jgi:hypothetical protein
VQYRTVEQAGIVQASRRRSTSGIGTIEQLSDASTHLRACFSGVRTTRTFFMKKILPATLFGDPERSRLTILRTWVLDNEVTEIEMNERQFWNFAHLQPIAEKPWTTFMGRLICVPDMPIDAQKHLGIFDKRSPGAI